MLFVDLLEESQPVHARHDDIGEDEIAGTGLQARERLAAGEGSRDLPLFRRQQAAEEIVNGRVVIDDEKGLVTHLAKL